MSFGQEAMNEGSAIVIRRYRPEDAPRHFEAVSESLAEISPWMPWCHPAYSLEESRAWIAHCGRAWEEGSEYNFAVADQSDHLLGSCGLNQFRLEHRLANLGYWIRTSATGRSVATTAVQRLIEFAFQETTFDRLEIVIALGNVASDRVAEKVDAVREGIARDRLHLHGRPHDATIYAVLRSRYVSKSLERFRTPSI